MEMIITDRIAYKSSLPWSLLHTLSLTEGLAGQVVIVTALSRPLLLAP